MIMHAYLEVFGNGRPITISKCCRLSQPIVAFRRVIEITILSCLHYCYQYTYCVYAERFHCLAVWTEEDFQFIVFASPSSQSARYVLVSHVKPHYSVATTAL